MVNFDGYFAAKALGIPTPEAYVRVDQPDTSDVDPAYSDIPLSVTIRGFVLRIIPHVVLSGVFFGVVYLSFGA
ncbi:MAG: hypothetical protein DI537_46550 [Stutzerimonas stutzeri]|nr:MAG: hypothetical protein DI537_46550 [Stutzerimonas stutzeri]